MNNQLHAFSIAGLSGFFLSGMLASSNAIACASCGCSLSSDAAMGYSSQPGWRVSLQNDYIKQDDLRTGTGSASPSQVINSPTTGELEGITINRYTTLGLSYMPSASWGLTLLIPYVNRSHTSYTDALSAPLNSADLVSANLSSSHSSGLGDVKLIAHYQGFLPTHNMGVQIGLKLPTGAYGDRVHFSGGPSSGEALDASLQPGTGSTDLILGFYNYQAISQNWDDFISAQYQTPIAHRLDGSGNDFRPGNQTSLSFGVRYEAHPQWVPQFQVNITHKSADSGALADAPDSAGTMIYLSPGISISISIQKKWQIYGFVQTLAYSKLDGYQLAPRWTATIGLSYKF